MKLRSLLPVLAIALLVVVGLVFRRVPPPTPAAAIVDSLPSSSPGPPSKASEPRAVPPPSAQAAHLIVQSRAPSSSPAPRLRFSDVEIQSRGSVLVELVPPRVASPEPVLPGFVGSEEWKNRGTSTASAAFETHCWAIYNGDVDALLSTVNPSPVAREKLKTIFDRLPPADQEKYGSPERMLAMVWVYHGLPFPAFMIQSEVQRSPTEVSVLLQLQYDQRGADRDFSFTREADGWRKVTPDQQVYSFLRMSGIDVPGVPVPSGPVGRLVPRG